MILSILLIIVLLFLNYKYNNKEGFKLNDLDDNYEILYNTKIINENTQLYKHKFDNIDDIITFFKNSYSSMVSIDLINLTGYFNIYIDNIYKNDDVQKTNDKNFITINKKNKFYEHALLIPTYNKHKTHFINLINSIFENVTGTFSINIIFSDNTDCVDIMDDIIIPKHLLDRVYIYIYNLPYTDDTKFTYQTNKKFYGLLNIPYKYCMIVDSDFYFLKTNLNDDINKYKNIIIKNIPILPFDIDVLKNINELLNTDYTFFPLELPWIYEKEKVINLNKFLLKKNIDITKINLHKPIFEVILYKFFCYTYYKNDYEIINLKNKGFLFEKHNTHNYTYAIHHVINNNSNNSNIKLIVHLDRIDIINV